MEKDQAKEQERSNAAFNAAAERAKLKNSFRDEVVKVPEAVQLRRDQEVLLSQLQLQADMHERDKMHLGESGSCKMLKEQIDRLNTMPPTEGTEAIIANLMQQMKGIETAINQSAPTWAQGVYLKTLKQVLGQGQKMELPGELISQGQTGEALVGQGGPVPISPEVAKKLSGPKLGPIKTDDDDDDGDD